MSHHLPKFTKRYLLIYNLFTIQFRLIKKFLLNLYSNFKKEIMRQCKFFFMSYGNALITPFHMHHYI
jgi:hypothetical protein